MIEIAAIRQLERRTLTAEARECWERNSSLRMAFADFGDFLQSFSAHAPAARDGALSDVLDGFASSDSAAASTALARLAWLRGGSPIASGMGFAQRRDGRLILWLYGPVAVQAGVAGSVDANEVVRVLEEHSDAQAVICRIDTPGGIAAHAEQIAIALKAHRGRKVAIIDRQCFSAGIFFIAAADRVLMRRDATLMIHRYKRSAFGDHRDLKRFANELRDQDEALIRHLTVARGLHSEKVRQLMDAEAYLSASEACAVGLVDGMCAPLFAYPAGSAKAPLPATISAPGEYPMSNKSAALRSSSNAVHTFREAHERVAGAVTQLRELDAAIERHRNDMRAASEAVLASIPATASASEIEQVATKSAASAGVDGARLSLLEKVRARNVRALVAAKIALYHAERAALLQCAEESAAESAADRAKLIRALAAPIARLIDVEHRAGVLGAASRAAAANSTAQIVGPVTAESVLLSVIDDLTTAVEELRAPMSDAATFPAAEELRSDLLTSEERARMHSIRAHGDAAVDEFMGVTASPSAAPGLPAKQPGATVRDYYDLTWRNLLISAQNAKKDVHNARSARERNEAQIRADYLQGALDTFLKVSPDMSDADVVREACATARQAMSHNATDEARVASA